MPITSHHRTALTALVLLAGATGCGEDRLSRDEYTAELQPAVQRISQGFGSVFERIGRAEDGERVPAPALQRLGQVAAQERRTAERLAGLEPPKDVEAVAGRFADGARRQADRLAAMSRERDVTVGELADAVEQGETAAPLRDLVEQGYVRAPGE